MSFESLVSLEHKEVGKYIYDFDDGQWKKVTKTATLPYDLGKYIAEDAEYITCDDSYRLCDEPFDIKEETWRDELTDGSLVLYDGREWKVGWVKADIVHGVLLGAPRNKTPYNMMVSKYIYKESRRISFLETPKITPIEYEMPRLPDLPLITVNLRDQNVYFTEPDIKAYYLKLNRYPYEITREFLANHPRYPPNLEIEDYTIPIFGLVLVGCDCIYTTVENSELSGDAVFGIEVSNATYARLKFRDHVFEMEKIGNIFTFPDLTYDNPLFSADKFNCIIETDGEVKYRAIYMRTEHLDAIGYVSNGRIMSRLQDKLIFNSVLGYCNIYPKKGIINDEKIAGYCIHCGK